MNNIKKQVIKIQIWINKTSHGKATLGFFILLVFWSFVTYGNLIPPIFIATPVDVLRAFVYLTFEQNFIFDILISVFRITVGFLLSLLVAIPLGALITSSQLADRILSPPLSFIRYLPVPALVPLLILWQGIGEYEKLSVVFVGVFFQLVFMTADILRSTPSEFIEVARTLGASKLKILLTIVYPCSLPALYDAARVTLGWAWGWVMLAELVGAESGIGHVILISQRYLQIANMIAGLLVVGLLGIITDALFTHFKPRLFPWTAS